MDFLDDNELGFWVSGDDAMKAIDSLLQQTKEVDLDMERALSEKVISAEYVNKWKSAAKKIIEWITKQKNSYFNWRLNITSENVLETATSSQDIVKAYRNNLANLYKEKGVSAPATIEQDLPVLSPESGSGFKIDIGGLALPILALGVGYLAFKRK
jgi:hypothetical protein